MENEKRYIGDIGEPVQGKSAFTLAIGLLALSLVIGFLVGLAVWALLWVSNAAIELVWTILPQAAGSPAWLSFATCVVGGLAIGLWTKAFNNSPKHMEEVLASVKKTGGFKLKGNLLTNAVSFVLPLAFGGSIGPEAGLTGIIAAGCTWIGETLRKAGIQAKTLADVSTAATLSAIFGAPLMGIAAAAGPLNNTSESEQFDIGEGKTFTYRKSAKIVMYALAAAGAFGGIFLVKQLLGGGMELPRFDRCSTELGDLAWILVAIAAAYALTWVFFGSSFLMRKASIALGDRPILKPVLMGIVLGIAAVLLPITLFAGETQATLLMETWTAIPLACLILIPIVKVVLTVGCLTFGWNGGQFFPCIFAGVACGFAVAAISGADPMLMTVVSTATFLGGIMRKPVVAAALLVMCFPLSGMVWGLAAAVIGAKLPLPKILLESSH